MALYDRTVSAGASHRQIQDEKAAAFDNMQRQAENVSLARGAFAGGQQRGYNQGVEESSVQLAGLKEQLQSLFGNNQPQDPGLANQFSEEAEQQRRAMEDDARQSAFMRAQDMRDTSEDNMNRLIDEELIKRGL